MSVKQRLYHSVCIFIYKIPTGVLPVSLRNRIEIVGSESQRQTRQAGNIVLELRKTRNAQKSVFYEGVKMYNFLPLRMKQCDILKIFKRVKRIYFEYAIFLLILSDSIIDLFCCVLHFVFIFYSVIFCSLYFVLYILYLKIAEKAQYNSFIHSFIHTFILSLCLRNR